MLILFRSTPSGGRRSFVVAWGRGGRLWVRCTICSSSLGSNRRRRAAQQRRGARAWAFACRRRWRAGREQAAPPQSPPRACEWRLCRPLRRNPCPFGKGGSASGKATAPVFESTLQWSSPLVEHAFRKADGVFQGYGLAACKADGTGELAEHLVLVGFQHQHFHMRRAVEDGGEGEVDPLIRRSELPGGEVIEGAVLLFGDLEDNVFELIRNAVHKQHIFRGCLGVAKAVAEVETELSAVIEHGVEAAPIPGVFVGPNAAAPIQKPHVEGVLAKLVGFFAHLHVAGGAHQVDLLIEVKIGVRFAKGGGDAHPILREVGQLYVHKQGLPVVEVVEVAAQVPFILIHAEAHIHLFALVGGFAHVGGRGQGKLAEGEGDDLAFGLLEAVVKVQQGGGDKPHIAVVRDGQGNAKVFVAYVVVIPFLDAEGGSPDLRALVVPRLKEGVARAGKASVLVQKVGLTFDFVLHTSSKKPA